MNAFDQSFQNSKILFDAFFLKNLKKSFDSYPSSRVSEAALYSLEAGGKRIRPIICINSFYANSEVGSYQPANQEQRNLLLLASSLECLHTYSLIHDDLPSMDNDDLRRGHPTCHKKFDEVTAILAGDALNSYGFYLLSQMISEVEVIKDCYSILHEGVGIPGMITGQMEDLIEEGRTAIKKDSQARDPKNRLYSIHNKKTGALIVSSFLLGNRLRSDHFNREKDLRTYAELVGLLFQITDDILDVEGDSKAIGKTPGKDQKSGKLTFPELFGLEGSKKLRDETKTNALTLAHKLDNRNDSFFIGLPEYLANRKN